MHESRGVKVFLSCSSRPIIENCQDIEFAGYPSVIAEKVRLSGVEEEEWIAKEMVDDFNWLRKEHSPNWRIQRDTIKGEVWGKVLDTMAGGSASVDMIRQILEE
jgi:tubulin-specific chaperone C